VGGGAGRLFFRQYFLVLNFAQNHQLTDHNQSKLKWKTQQKYISVESKQNMATWRTAWADSKSEEIRAPFMPTSSLSWILTLKVKKSRGSDQN
jgi:hypothetical protein